MSPKIIPAHRVPLPEQAVAFNEAFANYVAGSVKFDTAGLARFILHQGIDLVYSSVVRDSNQFSGIAYVSRTGEITRLAGMGIVPAARRTGIGRLLVNHVMDEAKERHDKAVVLEVIEQNPAAHQLYQACGFEKVSRLLSWRLPAQTIRQQRSDQLEFISLTVASQLPSALEFPEVPWQISRHAIAKLSSGRAFRLENSFVVIGDPEAPPVRIHALGSETRTIHWDELRNALNAVLDRYLGREFFAPPIFPETFGENVFRPIGFVQDSLSQFLMRHDLSA